MTVDDWSGDTSEVYENLSADRVLPRYCPQSSLIPEHEAKRLRSKASSSTRLLGEILDDSDRNQSTATTVSMNDSHTEVFKADKSISVNVGPSGMSLGDSEDDDRVIADYPGT